MRKSDLLTRLSTRLSFTKEEADFVVKVFWDLINEGLLEDKRVSTPMGVFKLVKRKEKRFRNINTKEIDVSPERYEVKFTPIEKIKVINE